MSAVTAAASADDDRDFHDTLLWLAQWVVGGLFVVFGIFKLTAPLAELAQAMRWPGEFPAFVVRTLARSTSPAASAACCRR